MQTDKLYPTSGTPQYGIEATAAFMNIPELVNDMGNQYLMGYVNSDDISLAAPVEIINGGGTVTMSKVPGNFGWGYAQWGYTGSYGPGTLYYNNNGTLTRSWGINYDFSFFNAIEMARVNTQTKLIPYISVAAIKSDLINVFRMSEFQNFSEDTVAGTTLDNFVEDEYTIDWWKNMVENDLPIFSGTVTINGTPITLPLTLRPSDFEHENGEKFALIPTDNGYTLHCRIMGLKIGDTKYYYDATHTISYNIVPFFQFPDTKGNPTIVVPGTLLFTQIDLHYENGSIYVTQGNAGMNYYNELFLQGDSSENSRIFGGFDLGAISVNDVDFTQVFSNNKSWWCFVGNYVMYLRSKSGGHAIFRVDPMYTPRDIYNYVRFWHKRTDTPSDTYSSEDTVTVFTNSNSPTLRTVSGTLSDIQLDLQPWQYPGIDITVNTFTPGNIPDSSGAGTNLLRFGNITPTEFLFGDVSIEKIYFGSSLLYQKFVPEQYVKLIPTDKFTIENTSADDYRVYGPLPIGEIVLSVRTPRTKNLLPYPYPGIYYHSASGSGRWQKSDNSNFTFTDNGNGTYDVPAQTTQNWKTMFQICGSPHYDEHPGILIGPGAYMMSFRIDNSALSDRWPQLEICCISAETGRTLLNITDLGSYRHTGRISFSVSERCRIHARLYLSQNMPINAHTIAPQLEAGSTVTEYEPPNDPTLTTITLPRALEENEYISYADQKIMPTGTPLVVPKLKTKVGENVIMIENYPTATNTITLTPATKE